MEKQTALDWIDENIQSTMFIQYGYSNGVRKIVIPLEDYMRLKQEANQMFEQQIKEAYEQGSWNGRYDDAEEYYSQTFKNK